MKRAAERIYARLARFATGEPPCSIAAAVATKARACADSTADGGEATSDAVISLKRLVQAVGSMAGDALRTAEVNTRVFATPSAWQKPGSSRSVGSVGDSYDNALAETINGLYKAEVIHRRRWPSRAAVEMATLAWVDWYNHRRLLEPIGDIPPAEADANYYRQLSELAKAA